MRHAERTARQTHDTRGRAADAGDSPPRRDAGLTTASGGRDSEEFGRGRAKVHATFDGQPYDGSVVNMGVTDDEGNACHVIGLLKAIRARLGKGEGDVVHVVIRPR